jgi:hypothetical protein
MEWALANGSSMAGELVEIGATSTGFSRLWRVPVLPPADDRPCSCSGMLPLVCDPFEGHPYPATTAHNFACAARR